MNERSLNWCLVLYPLEDISHSNALEFIKKNYSSYAFIQHDLDMNDDSTLKKSHVHVVLHFTNYRWKTAIAEELKITDNYLEKCRNIENALKYLIHFNDENKTQYDIENVQGPLKKKLYNYINNNDKDESDKVLELIDYIDSFNSHISLSYFIRHCCSLGYFDVYRRSSGTFMKLIDEHNIHLSY